MTDWQNRTKGGRASCTRILTMKIKINKKEATEPKPFPKLMQSTASGRVCLFLSESECIVMTPIEHFGDTFGARLIHAQHHLFRDFGGSITLSND